jgi:hypothetical protein
MALRDAVQGQLGLTRVQWISRNASVGIGEIKWSLRELTRARAIFIRDYERLGYEARERLNIAPKMLLRTDSTSSIPLIFVPAEITIAWALLAWTAGTWLRHM